MQFFYLDDLLKDVKEIDEIEELEDVFQRNL